MPKIAQSYDVKLFIKMFFHFFQICINDLFLLNIFMFLSSTCAHCIVISKYTYCELIMIFELTEIFILDLCMFSFEN
jgi:hypothetical protein